MTQLVYWRDEVSGKLAAAVEAYITEDRLLTPEEVALLSAYLKIWIDFPWAGAQSDSPYGSQFEALRQSFDEMVVKGNRGTISQWLDQLLQTGIDPL